MYSPIKMDWPQMCFCVLLWDLFPLISLLFYISCREHKLPAHLFCKQQKQMDSAEKCLPKLHLVILARSLLTSKSLVYSFTRFGATLRQHDEAQFKGITLRDLSWFSKANKNILRFILGSANREKVSRKPK